MLTLDKIRSAEAVLSGAARKTDILLTGGIADGCELWLKTENLQRTGSFKLRGAYYKLSQLTEEERLRGVVACSAGNHAQGVALASQKFGIKATIFLPSSAPISKIEATRRYGAEIRLSDGAYDEAYAEALALSHQTGATFVHPFDDEDVIAGQATIGLELLEQLPSVDAVVVPVGGGGLLAGIAYAIKRLKPGCRVYGVQAAGADSMCRSYCESKYMTAAAVSTFSDGIAVKAPGKLTYDLCRRYADTIVTVKDDETATAILALMERQKLVAEGAGAVAVAAVMFGKLPVEGKKVCAVVSGGNIDMNILSRVINRGLLTAGRLTNLTICLTDKPGQLKKVSTIIADEGANVIRVQYTPGGENMDINGCYIRISMETKNHAHLEGIKRALKRGGFTICNDL